LLALLVPTVVSGQTASGAVGERLSLEAAIRTAIENNRQRQTARLQVDKEDADVAAARTRRLPAVQMEVTASQLITPAGFSFPQGAFGNFPGTGPIPSVDTTLSVPRQPTYYVSSQVSQPISQLFRIGLGIRSAATTRDIERERARAEQLSLINSVKRLYFAILQTESALAANNDALALYRELDRFLQVRVAQRVALRSDALEVQVRLAQEELSRTTRQNALASQKEQLNQLLGRDVRTPFEVEDVTAVSALEVDLTAAQSHALENRPDVREARLKLQQADLDRRITKADRIPEVSLAVSYMSNFNIDVLPTNLATVGVRVEWEPFDWGRRKLDLAAKTRTVEQAQLGVRDVEDRTLLDINSRFRTLAEKRALVTVAQMGQTATREKLRVKSNQYQVQAALLPDVLQVRAELADSDDRYQRAMLDFWTARSALAAGARCVRRSVGPRRARLLRSADGSGVRARTGDQIVPRSPLLQPLAASARDDDGWRSVRRHAAVVWTRRADSA
jgi:outer membrane protein TolC